MPTKNPINVSYTQPVLATDLRVGDNRSSRIVGSNGDLNASSKSDLIKQILRFQREVAANGAVTEDEAVNRSETARFYREVAHGMFHDADIHRELGAALGNDIQRANNRDGFARRFMANQPLTLGQRPQVMMEMKDVTAQIASSSTQVQTQFVRDPVFFPQEFPIAASIFIDEVSIAQNSGDILNRKFMEGLTGTMVVEDRLWKAMAIEASSADNTPVTFVTTMSAGGLMAFINQVGRWQLTPTSLLMANDLMTDFVQDTSFQNVFDPISKHTLLTTGQFGTIFGTTLTTDAFRHQAHRVLDRGEMFVVSDPITHGQYTDRNGVSSEPRSGAHEKIVGRGWFLSEIISMMIINSRSVARGVRT